MNRKNILEIARALVDEVADFDMSISFAMPTYGSAGCIAGHIAYLHPKRTIGINRLGPGSAAALEALPLLIERYFEISTEDAIGIYAGRGWPMAKIDRWIAATALVRYINTGKVDFKPTFPSVARAMVEEAERKFLH